MGEIAFLEFCLKLYMHTYTKSLSILICKSCELEVGISKVEDVYVCVRVCLCYRFD